jgi:hypothetical protein
MKKIVITSLLSILIIGTGQAQVLISLIFGDKLNSDKIEFGLDGGLSLTNLKGPEGANNRTGLNLGFYLDIKTKNPAWMISTGVMVKGPMGAQGLPVYGLGNNYLDSAFKGGSVTTNLGYFYVPATMKYSFKNHLYVRGGIQLGLINAASDEFINSITDDDDLKHTINRKKDFAALDAGLTAGIGYRLLKGNGMNITFNYYYGLVDVESDDSGPDVFNRALYFNVGIPIGKGKAQKTEKK